ncbi:MAG: hypothetical protein WDW38_001300 [Sanguina aurantia]
MAAMSGATGLTDGPVQANITATAVPSGVELLPCKEDFYSGIIVTPELLPADVATFTQQMLLSLTAWKAMGKRGIWLKIPTARVALIAPAVEQGVQVPSRRRGLRHADSLDPIHGLHPPSKLLTSGDSARHSLDARSSSLACTRCQCTQHAAHGFAFGKSDLFMLCALYADTANQELVPQASEIDAVKWMELAEYMDNPFMKGIALYDLMRERCFAYTQGRYRGLNAAKMEAGSSRQRIDLLMWGADDASGVTGTAPAAPAAMPSVNPSSL